MPRIKKITASSSFFVRPRQYSDAVKLRLVELLGHDYKSDMPNLLGDELALIKSIMFDEGTNKFTAIGILIHHIENAASVAIDGQPHLNDIPRAADYVREFKKTRKMAFTLCEYLINWSDFFSTQAASHGADTENLQRELATFVDTATQVIKTFENQSSKGAAKNVALHHSIRMLRRLFRNGYQGEYSERTTRGGIVTRAVQEDAELEFVHLALSSIEAIPNTFDRDKLERYFLLPECAAPGERNSTIKRIADRKPSQ